MILSSPFIQSHAAITTEGSKAVFATLDERYRELVLEGYHPSCAAYLAYVEHRDVATAHGIELNRKWRSPQRHTFLRSIELENKECMAL